MRTCNNVATNFVPLCAPLHLFRQLRFGKHGVCFRPVPFGLPRFGVHLEHVTHAARAQNRLVRATSSQVEHSLSAGELPDNCLRARPLPQRFVITQPDNCLRARLPQRFVIMRTRIDKPDRWHSYRQACLPRVFLQRTGVPPLPRAPGESAHSRHSRMVSTNIW
jgi:hypothetical protein